MSQPVQRNETTAFKRNLLFYLVQSDGKTPYVTANGNQPSISINGGSLQTSGVGIMTHLGNGLYSANVLSSVIGQDAIICGFYGLSPGTVDSCTPTPSFNTLQFTGNDPYALQILPADIWEYQTRTLTALGDFAAQSIWNADESAIVSGIGLRVKTNLDDQITSRSTFNASTNQVFLAPTGLDIIPITEFIGRATTFSQLLIAIYMRFYNEVDQTATTQTIKKSDGSTVVSGTVSNSGGTQVKGRLS